jgi:ribonuclease BN (tRNA processing enzyme)
MKIHLLGTAGYHPGEDRHTACLMVPEAGVVLDAGTGFFRVRDLIQTPELHIFLTHSHLDHCVGLSFYLDVLNHERVQNVYVYGAAEKLAAIREHLFSSLLFPLQPDFQWIPLPDGAGNTGILLPHGGKLTWCPLTHPGGSLGFRMDWPESSVAYITDTTATVDAGYVSFIRSVNLLIHECHFPDGFEDIANTTGHSCLSAVAHVCATASVGQCVIVHLNPRSASGAAAAAAETPDPESVRSIYPYLRIGRDKMVLDF